MGYSGALAQGFAAAKAGLQRQQIQPSCTGAGGSLKPIGIQQLAAQHLQAAANAEHSAALGAEALQFSR